MCGILGGNNKNWDYYMGIKSMEHRGPDGFCIKQYSNVTFAFTRLSIRDLSEKAMQPMDSDNGKVHIVFNGEIYGYQKLKKELEKKYKFNTTSDTEVILNAYLEYGDYFIDYIDGMFAIAIYDERIEQIKLFRDRAGIKPLYYYNDGNDFLFASELKSIVETCKDKKFLIDRTAVYDYLLLKYIPEPKSVFCNIYKLPPANKLVFDVINKKIIMQERYWRLHVNTGVERKHKEKDIHDHLQYLIKKSVKDQMEADVPVGTFLSGGMDSSIITYEASTFNKKIETFSIGFQNKEYDELVYANMLVNKYNLCTNIKVLEKGDIKKIRTLLHDWFDEPFADTSSYPSYFVSKLASEKVKVVLTGDGGDELFGGYTRYAVFLDKRKNIKYTNRKLYRNLFYLMNEYGILNQKFVELFQTEFDIYEKLVGTDRMDTLFAYANKWKIDKDYDPSWCLQKYYIKDLPPLTRARYLDFKTYLPGDILTKVDRVSMSVSLESRVPFLSKDIIEFAFSLSEEECLENKELKGCLKYTYQDDIPNEILFRRKKGFSIPPYYYAKDIEGGIHMSILKNEWNEFA